MLPAVEEQVSIVLYERGTYVRWDRRGLKMVPGEDSNAGRSIVLCMRARGLE